MPTLNDPNGNPQAVRDNGYALTYAATMPMEAHAGDWGNAYTMVVDATPGGTDVDFAYMKNSDDMELRIYHIDCYCTGDVEIAVKVGCTGTATSPSTVTPVNALVGSGETATGTFQQRSGDLAMTGGSVFDTIFIDTSNNPHEEKHYSGELALAKNQTVLFNAVTNPSAAIEMTIFFYYHEKVVKP